MRAAKCYLMLGNPSLSVDYYHKVLVVEKKNKQAQDELVVSKKVLGHLEKAKKETERGEHRTVSVLAQSTSYETYVHIASVPQLLL